MLPIMSVSCFSFKGIDPKTNKTITAASHDEFDVSSTTNGEDGDCEYKCPFSS